MGSVIGVWYDGVLFESAPMPERQDKLKERIKDSLSREEDLSIELSDGTYLVISGRVAQRAAFIIKKEETSSAE